MNTLSDLRWFSFSEELDKLDALTIWQAIGLILSHAPKAEAAFEQYMEDLTQLETDSANDIIDFNNEASQPTQVKVEPEIKALMADDFDGGAYHLDQIVLSPGATSEELDLLETNRQTLVEALPLPSLVYRLLINEIDSAAAGLPSILRLTPDEYQTMIKRTSLKAWRDSRHLDTLQLVHNDPKAKRRKVRSDLEDNPLLVIHALVRLLEEAAPEQYSKRSTQLGQTTHMSNLYEAMSRRAQGQYFQTKRTVDNIIHLARAQFQHAKDEKSAE